MYITLPTKMGVVQGSLLQLCATGICSGDAEPHGAYQHK